MKKFVISSVAVASFAFALVASAATAADMGSVTLRQGSRGAAVSALQSNLNNCAGQSLSTDGIFGSGTAAAVRAFQSSKGLTVDALVGNGTKSALNVACAGTSTNNNNNNTNTGSTTLNGGAGDATITSTSTDVENSLKEDESDVKVLGFQVEADGSDINVSNVKVVFQNDGYDDLDGAGSDTTSSEKLTNYIDSVSIMMGSTEVGSADASDFSRESGTPDTFTKTISLKDAVVKEDKKVKFYVAVTANSTIDSVDLGDADWNVELSTVRFNDATGAILSLAGNGVDFTVDENFSFDDANTDDKLSIKASSADPDAANLIVEEDNTSDEYMIGAFKLEVDDNSSDISITEMPVVVSFDNLDVNGATAGLGSSTSDSAVEKVIDTLKVKIGSTSVDAELDSGSVSIVNGSGTATYIVDLSDEDLTIDAGDTEEVKIYAVFNDQDGNYNSGAKISVDVDADDMEAEGSDELTSSQTYGVFSSEEHTLIVSGAAVTYSSSSFTAENIADAVDGTISLTFKVEAIGEDVVFAEDASDFTYTLTGATETDAIVTVAGKTAQSGDFTISEGDTKTVTLSVKFNTTAGFVRLELTNVSGTSVSNVKTQAY